jgi:hypothetical protein
MSNSVEIPQLSNQYVRQFNRAVLEYQLFISEQRRQKKSDRHLSKKSKVRRKQAS